MDKCLKTIPDQPTIPGDTKSKLENFNSIKG